MRWLTLRVRMGFLVLAGVLPLLAFNLGSVYSDYRQSQARAGRQALDLARNLAVAVEGELQTRIATLQVLALSRSLAAGDMIRFRGQAEAVVAHQMPGVNILLAREDGQQLMNTRFPPEAPLPVRPDLVSQRRVFATGRPSISDLYFGAVRHRLVVAIEVPVLRSDGSVSLTLALNPTLDAFDSIIRRQKIGEGWLISVLDRTGRRIARVPVEERMVGRPAAPDFLRAWVGASEGTLQMTSPEGVPVVAAFSRLPDFGWTVAVALPTAESTGPACRSAMISLAVGLGLLILGLALAHLVSGSISQPILALRRLASAVGDAGNSGLFVPSLPKTHALGEHRVLRDPRTTGLRETDEVAEALRMAEEERAHAKDLAAILAGGIATISAGFVIYDDQDRMVTCNESYRGFHRETADFIVPGVRFEDIMRHDLAHDHYPIAKGREEEWLAERLLRHRDPQSMIELQLHDGRWVLVTKSLMPNGFVAGLRVDISSLKAAEQALGESEQRLRRAQRLGHMGSDQRDLRTNTAEWSDEKYRIFGVTRDTYVPSTANLFRMLHPEDHEKMLAAQAGIAHGICPPPFEYRIIRPDGSVRHLYRENELIPDATGAIRWVAGTVHDITERHQVEIEKERQQRELERSNADLEAFAYSASHDLKSPLRAIAHLAEWIRNDIEATASPDTIENLLLLKGRVARLEMLTDGLLAYSRIARDEGVCETVNIAEMVAGIVGSLEVPRGIVVTSEADMKPLRTMCGRPLGCKR